MPPDLLLYNWRSLYGAPPDFKSVIVMLRGDRGASALNKHIYRKFALPFGMIFWYQIK
jgi:hypothetical protein